MDESHEGTFHGGLNTGGSRTLSRLDDVGAGVRLRARLTDFADEDVNPTKGDLIPVFD